MTKKTTDRVADLGCGVAIFIVIVPILIWLIGALPRIHYALQGIALIAGVILMLILAAGAGLIMLGIFPNKGKPKQ